MLHFFAKTLKGLHEKKSDERGFTLIELLVVDKHSVKERSTISLPTLIHTGMYPVYEGVRNAVAEVIDPASLAYVVCPHFEADECGGMGRFVEEAPEAVLACSEAGAFLNLTLWDYSGPVRGFRDGDTIDPGERKLRFIETPHVHHWDSMMVFEEATGSLFSSDLYIQWETNRQS